MRSGACMCKQARELPWNKCCRQIHGDSEGDFLTEKTVQSLPQGLGRAETYDSTTHLCKHISS